MTNTYRITREPCRTLKTLDAIHKNNGEMNSGTNTSTPLKNVSSGWQRIPKWGYISQKFKKDISATYKVHLIFFLKREGSIDIIGIPHQRMDIGKFFS